MAKAAANGEGEGDGERDEALTDWVRGHPAKATVARPRHPKNCCKRCKGTNECKGKGYCKTAKGQERLQGHERLQGPGRLQAGWSAPDPWAAPLPRQPSRASAIRAVSARIVSGLEPSTLLFTIT